MMNPKIKPCRTCEKDVATDAQKCPHCGAPMPAVAAGGAIQGVLALVVLGLLGYAIWNLLQIRAL